MPSRELIGVNAPPSATLPLDGTEVLHVVQGGESTVTTTQDIADLAAGGTASDATPAALGNAAAGVATAYSRGDHVHQAPTPAGIGAATVAEVQTAQSTADGAASAATAAQGTANNAVTAAGVAQTTADGAATAASTHSARTDNPHSVTAAQVGADPKTTVQTAHTTSTLTLANADNNQHRALNTASNSIAISIPDTLTFPFVWTARKSSASNSVTITTGAGLITPKVSGTVPVTAVDAWITIFAESSTVAAVFVTVAT